MRSVINDTLQDALIDFLIDWVGHGYVPDWLRAQALIMAHPDREPEWLAVKTPVIGEDGKWPVDRLTSHTMKIAQGSSDALSRETYDVLVREDFGARERYPLRNYEVKRLIGGLRGP